MHRYLESIKNSILCKIWTTILLGSLGMVISGERVAYSDSLEDYTWDNWFSDPVKITVGDSSEYTHLRFALESPKFIDGKFITPNQRHAHARIAMYARVDSKRWIRLATVIKKTPTWSGSVMNCYECAIKPLNPLQSLAPSELNRLLDRVRISTNRSTMIFAYTERSFNPDPLGQRLSFAQFDDASQSFVRSSLPSIDPRGPDKAFFQNLGYMIEGNEVISAWRDPYLINDENGRLHVFFAARYNRMFHTDHGLEEIHGSFNPWSNSAIGHAEFDHENQTWLMHPPLKLDRSPVQFELPQIMEHAGKYYLFQLQADWDSSNLEAIKSERNRKHALLVYKSSSLYGPWMPFNQGNAKIADLDGIYGFTIKPLKSGSFIAAAFFEKDVSMTSTAVINIKSLQEDIIKAIKQFKAAETIKLQCR